MVLSWAFPSLTVLKLPLVLYLLVKEQNYGCRVYQPNRSLDVQMI